MPPKRSNNRNKAPKSPTPANDAAAAAAADAAAANAIDSTNVSNNTITDAMSQKSQKSNKSRKTQKSKNSQKSQQTSDKSQTPGTSRKTNQEPDGINGNKMPSSINKRQISTSPKIPPLRISRNGRPDDVSEVSGSVNESDELKNALKRVERLEEELRQARRASRGPTAHNYSHLYDRDTVDLAPVDIVTNGIALTTSPVMFKVEDSAWWRYSGDMMRLVEILEVTPPTPIRRQPNYFVRCQNGQTHSVSHTDLFLSRERATEIDLDGRITSDPDLFSATDRMDLYAIEGLFTTQQAIQWKALDGTQFKISTLQTALKDLKLETDSILELQSLHDSISTAIAGASTNGLLKLPSLQELSPTVSIRDIWLPPPTHHRFSSAVACYGNIASCIKVLLTRKDFSATAPKAKFAIATVSASDDGLDALYALYRARIPVLGATDFNAYVEIMGLQVEHGTLLINFINTAQDIEAQLSLSSHPPNDNSLFKQFLTQLMKTNVHSYVGITFSDFNIFLKQSGGREKYTKHTIKSVSQMLIDGCAPSTLYLMNKVDSTGHRHDINNLSPFKDAIAKHKSRSNFSKLKFANMQIDSEDRTNLDTLEEEEIECTQEELDQAQAAIEPYFESLKETYSGDLEELHGKLLFSAMEQIKSESKKKQCEICNSEHPEPCWLRGPNFQPNWLKKRIEQVNLRDGNEPAQPPNENVTPPKASFSKQKTLRFNSMSHQLDDSDQDIEAMLDSIQECIKQDIDSGNLSVEPKLASIKVSNSIDLDAANADSIPGPAVALQVDDYSALGGQDFC